MPNAALIVLADVQTHADLGRVVTAMTTAKEFNEAGDDVRLIFDGAGTQWPGQLSKPPHRAHALWLSVRHVVTGACSYCAGVFDATAALQQANIPLLDEYQQHASVRALVVNGFQVITF